MNRHACNKKVWISRRMTVYGEPSLRDREGTKTEAVVF
ncbi:hypothetical protein NBRC111894_2202 [Sporolactobacillus inulinus]|uniref:Uncharacterized protein n=1 Tax=Sporolactobacillus inulinus TaxID=2078 RepID=A0A4Y1ZDH4_9BACL|nr:hypothetical protein NBRC111894_2202 [Sporolactobacillus inulinus]